MFDAVDEAPLQDEDRLTSVAATTTPTRHGRPPHPSTDPCRVLAVVRSMWPSPEHDEDDATALPSQRSRPTLQRFGLMTTGVCQTLAAVGRLDDLDEGPRAADRGLRREMGNGPQEPGEPRRDAHRDRTWDLATSRTDGLVVRVADAFVREGLRLTDGPMFEHLLFKWAHLVLDVEEVDRAIELVGQRPLETQVTPRGLGYTQGPLLQSRFEYWRAPLAPSASRPRRPRCCSELVAAGAGRDWALG